MNIEQLKRIGTHSIPGESTDVLYKIALEAERFQERLFPGQNRGFIPLRDLLARRLINKKDWDRLPENAKTYVRNIYQPSPSVWDNWVEVAKVAHLRNEHESELVSADWFNVMFERLSKVSVFTDQMKRNTGSYGNCSSFSSALNGSQIQELTSKGVLRFTRTKCWECLTPFEQARHRDKPLGLLTEPFEERRSVTADGKYCGYINYPDPVTSRRLFSNLIEEINTAWKQLQQRPDTIDPIFFAACAQKKMITIHPFSDYNGRLSRFLMDRILTNIGLPPPILDDMDADITTPDSEWAKQVGQGVLNTVNGLRKCACNPNTPDCRSVFNPPEPTVYPAYNFPPIGQFYPMPQFNF